MDTHPSWSPSGSQIAFSSNFDGDYDINVLDSELLCSICSNKRTSLTSNNSADSYPSFSPEGNRILFVNNSAGPLSIFTMDKDGSHKLQLTSNNSITGIQLGHRTAKRLHLRVHVREIGKFIS